MTDSHDPQLLDRIAALENELGVVKRKIAELEESKKSTPGRPADRPTVPNTTAPAKTKTTPKPQRRKISLGNSEQWINRVGMGLLLLGLVFLFKYSIDKGWLTPLIRLVFGTVLGLSLLIVGSRIKSSRRLGLVLVGGGIAALYTTLFAGHQLYELIPYVPAFAGMVVVTIIGFYFAIRQSTAVIAIVATVGGLNTPFLLHQDGGSLPALVVYLCIVVGSASALYFYRGWRSLISVAFIGGWLCLLVAWTIFDFGWFSGAPPQSDAIVFQLGIVFLWLAVGLIPAARIFLAETSSEKWAVAPMRLFKGVRVLQQPGHLLALSSPLIAAAMSNGVWDPGRTTWGLIMVGCAIIYAIPYLWLRNKGVPSLATIFGIVAAIFTAVSIFQLFSSNDYRFLLVVAEGVLLLWVARTVDDSSLRYFAHGALILLGFTLLDRLDSPADEQPIYNVAAACDLAVIILYLLAAWQSIRRELRIIYGLFGYVCFLSWLWRELSALPSGQAYVTLAWGTIAIGLIVYAWQRKKNIVRLTGLGTLFLVVGKLFVVDLSTLDAGWRILLFLGLGGLLLGLSYFFPQLWRGDEEIDSAEGSAPPTDLLSETPDE